MTDQFIILDPATTQSVSRPALRGRNFVSYAKRDSGRAVVSDFFAETVRQEILMALFRSML